MNYGWLNPKKENWGATLTNMPDEFIHAADNDEWKVDKTQMKRNTFNK